MQTLQQLYIENPSFTAQDLLDEYNNQPAPIGTITINDAVNFDATYFIDEMIQDYLDDPEGDQDIKKIIVRFRKIINGLLPFINIGDVTTQAALDKIIENVGDFTQEMRDALEGMARQPKPVVTIEQCRAVINPPIQYEVERVSGNHQLVLPTDPILEPSNLAAFKFVFEPNETFTGTITFGVKSANKKDGVFAESQATKSFTQTWEAGKVYSRLWQRPAILKGDSWFKPLCTETYAGSLKWVQCSSVV